MLMWGIFSKPRAPNVSNRYRVPNAPVMPPILKTPGKMTRNWHGELGLGPTLRFNRSILQSTPKHKIANIVRLRSRQSVAAASAKALMNKQNKNRTNSKARQNHWEQVLRTQGKGHLLNILGLPLNTNKRVKVHPNRFIDPLKKNIATVLFKSMR